MVNGEVEDRASERWGEMHVKEVVVDVFFRHVTEASGIRSWNARYQHFRSFFQRGMVPVSLLGRTEDVNE